MFSKPALGVGRALIAVYAVFALSATARASYQLFREFDQAPVAYMLSLISAFTYIVVTFSLAKPALARLARVMVWFELVGVLTVGVLSIAVPALFNHPSVWSGFGMGYGFLPLVLPILGIIWLSKRSA